MKKFAFFLSLIAFPILSFAQQVTYDHDQDDMNQINAMESGQWKFSPSLWYWIQDRLSSKNYSGTTLTSFKHKESRSAYQKLSPKRAAAYGIHVAQNPSVSNERKKVNELYKEQVHLAIDRRVDVAYPIYEDDFNSLKDYVNDAISFINYTSKNEMKPLSDKLKTRLTIINESIKYIHKNEYDTELESSKRMDYYISLKNKLQQLAKDSYQICLIATLNYN